MMDNDTPKVVLPKEQKIPEELHRALYKSRRARKRFKGLAKSMGLSQTRRVIKTGRNDLCPCGSGIKYKRCCE